MSFHFLKVSLFCGTFCFLKLAIAETVPVLDLLKQTDRARGGFSEGVTWDVELKSQEEGTESQRTFHVKAKGENALVESLAPARNKGEVFLFNDRSMWFFKSSLKKPVSISAREKLNGQAANGDIASTNYARDYTPTLETTETVGGDKFYVLLLKSNNKQVTYDQIRYWISDKLKLGIKAEFLTLQGKPLKKAVFEYKNTMKFDGKIIPFISQMTIVNAKFENNISVMKYTNAKLEKHPDSLFNINNISR